MSHNGVRYDLSGGLVYLKDGTVIHHSHLKDKFVDKNPYSMRLVRTALERLNYIDDMDVMLFYRAGG